MKIEALNCPNCGAAVSNASVQCRFCNSRLKTMACPACLELMFLGSLHCPHCGAKAVQTEVITEENAGNCPRCKIRLDLLKIDEIVLRECRKCDGFWADAQTFENICANRENQASVLGFIFTDRKPAENKSPAKVNYVPCPDCKQLMNRNNFARSSGVIIDICKQHGIWFDAEELPHIIEFINKGGLDHARQREKLEIGEQMKRLQQEQHTSAFDESAFDESLDEWNVSSSAIRSFVRFLFD
jgi:Zn-finger nucleic acid-binding protein